MTWIPRTPKRYDFCGCPPCPLCFVWAGDTGILDGLTKFTRDMLGTRTPTPQEKVVLASSTHPPWSIRGANKPKPTPSGG